MTALQQVILLTFFTLFACVICKQDEEPWVMVKEMNHIGYQMKSVKKMADGEKLTYVSLIQAPVPTTTGNGEDLIPVYTQEDGLSAVYEITKDTSAILQIPDFSLTSKTESLQVELNPLTVVDEQTDFAFNEFQLQVEKRDQAESTIYKMTFRDCDSYCDFSTTIGQNTTSGFEEIRDYDDQRKYVSMGPIFYEFHGRDKICSIQVNRAAVKQDAVKIMSLTFLIEINGKSWKEDFIYLATYGINLI